MQFLLKRKNTIVFWLTYWIFQSILMAGGEPLEFYLVKNVVIVGLQSVAVNINFKLLLPFFLEKKKFMQYMVSSILLIYILYSMSFVLIDIVFSIYYPDIKKIGDKTIFSFDFWRVLSGSSFYSLALVCSTTYILIKKNHEKDKVNQSLKTKLKTSKKNTITIKEGHNTHIVLTDDIYFVKGLKEYVVWHTKNKNIVALQTMTSIENDNKEKSFLRVHKSYIVNMEQVQSFDSNSIKIRNEVIPIGRVYKKNVEFFTKKRLN